MTLRRRAAHRWVSILLVLSALACEGTSGDPPPPPPEAPPPAAAPAAVRFDSATATLIADSRQIELDVEIADTPDRRAVGLMDRDELEPDRGMIFLYGEMQNEGTGFWMYRTRIPLDIAYFDGAGRIVAIQQMMPCASLDATRCPGYAAGVPFFGAIEANRGYFARNGIGVGDRVVLPGRIGG